MISFVNYFLTYLMMFLVIALGGSVAVAIGIVMRKNKNKKNKKNEKNEMSE